MRTGKSVLAALEQYAPTEEASEAIFPGTDEMLNQALAEKCPICDVKVVEAR